MQNKAIHKIVFGLKSAMFKVQQILLQWLFPSRNGGGNHGQLDFTHVSSKELWLTLPRSPPLLSERFPADVAAVLAYKHRVVRALIWHIKYKKDRAAVRHGGYILHQYLLEKNLPMPVIIIPIPISSARRRERGYNQCELLADAIGESDTLFEIRKDILIRSVHRTRQTFKDRRARMESSRGIFSVSPYFRDGKISEIKNRPILILDDVLTTGSTMREAMDVLKRAGFTNVRGVALGH